MKNFICITIGVAMIFANFNTSVYAGFQSHIVCGFSLEHETTGTTGSGTTSTNSNRTTAPSPNNNTNLPAGNTTPTTIIGPVGECPDPGYGGGSVAMALFGGIFLGMIILAGTAGIIIYRVAGDAFGFTNESTLKPLNNSQIGDYGEFKLEPAYNPELDARGLRFRFVF